MRPGQRTNFQIKPGGFGLLFLPGDTRTCPGKHLETAWSAGNWMVFLRLAPFRIACKASVPKVECLSTLEIECFFATRGNQVRDQVNTRKRPGKLPGNRQGGSRSAKIECKSQVKILNVKKLNAIFSWFCQVCKNWMQKLNVILCSQFECLSSVAYSHSPLLDSLHLLDLANLKSCVQFVVGLFSKLH